MAKKEKLFSDIDFKNSDRIGKMYIAIQDERFELQLSNQDEQYMKLLKLAYPIIVSGRPYFEVLRLIQNLEGGIWKTQALQIIKDAQDLYAAFDSIHPKILRGMMREKLLENLKRLESIADDEETDNATRIKASDSITKVVDTISKYAQLDKIDEESDTVSAFSELKFDSDLEATDYEEIQNTIKAANTVHDQADTAGMQHN